MASPTSRTRILLTVAATLLLPLVVLRVLASLLPEDDASSNLVAVVVAAGVFALGVRETRRLARESRRADQD